MSRPPPFRRYGTQPDDVEAIPLSSAPASEPWYQERDLTDERLPTYNEALADQPPPASGTSRPPPAGAYDSGIEMRPTGQQMQIFAGAMAEQRPRNRLSQKRVENISLCLLTPLIALIIGAVFSGVTYVNASGSPSPGLSSPATISQDHTTFLLTMIIWGLIAYPFFFAFLIIRIPQIFGLPKGTRSAASRESWRERHKKGGRKCCGLYCGLTVLYFGIIGVVIWLVFFVADKKWNQSFQIFAAESWAGNYVVVEKTGNGSVGMLFTVNGTLIGHVAFTELGTHWSVSINSSTENIQSIVYANNTQVNANVFPVAFNATCRANGTATQCLTGGLEDTPSFSLYQGRHQVAEYSNYLRFNISGTNGLRFAEVAPNGTEVITDPYQYQGIGSSYPPLGHWSVDNNTILDVMWSTNSSTACAGLRVNLSKNDELLAWPVVGLIWQWWKQWGELGGCSWS